MEKQVSKGIGVVYAHTLLQGASLWPIFEHLQNDHRICSIAAHHKRNDDTSAAHIPTAYARYFERLDKEDFIPYTCFIYRFRLGNLLACYDPMAVQHPNDIITFEYLSSPRFY